MKIKARVNNNNLVMRKTENGNLVKTCIEFETNESVDFDRFNEVEIDVPIVNKEKFVLPSGKELFLTEQEVKELRDIFAYPAYFPFQPPNPSPNPYPYPYPYPYPIITCDSNANS